MNMFSKWSNTPRGFRYVMRRIVAAVMILFTVWFIGCVWYDFTHTPDTIDTVEYDAYRASALQFIREDARMFIDAGILVLTALWSVAIVKKDDRLRRHDKPEIIMFLCSVTLLGMFLWYSQRYGQELERAYWNVGVLTEQKGFPNVNSEYLKLYGRTVTVAFYAGLAATAFTVLSLCIFRPAPSDLEVK